MKLIHITGNIITEDDYSRSDAAHDDFSREFTNWVDSEVIGSEYITVQDIFEKLNVGEEPWAVFDKMMDGGAEDNVVNAVDVKRFVQALKKSPEEAIQQYVRTVESLYNDDDLKGMFGDR